MVFGHWSIRRNTRFHHKAFLAIILLACYRGLFKVKNISNSLTYTVASSCVCTSPLAVLTIVGLNDFVKVSISALLKSFMLIMCIDAPESTTNFRSSGLRVDARRHLFSDGEKNVALSCSVNFNTLLASLHAASWAPCSCHSVSSRDRSSNFRALGLRSWGSPGQIYPSEGFWSRILVWRAIAFVNFTRWIAFGMSVPFRRRDFGGFMSWNTQPNCRASEDWRLDDFSPTFYHFSSPVSPVGRDIHQWQVLCLANFPFSIKPLHFCHHSF